MKTRIFTSMLVIALAAALVGGATMAWFTDADTNTANTFSAGTLSVDAGEQDYTVDIDKMAPGDTISGVFTVKNDGSLPLKYRVTDNRSGALFGGATPAVVTITSGGTGELDPSNTATVHYTVSLPTAANNTYQGATGTLSFTVQATQPANPGWAE